MEVQKNGVNNTLYHTVMPDIRHNFKIPTFVSWYLLLMSLWFRYFENVLIHSSYCNLILVLDDAVLKGFFFVLLISLTLIFCQRNLENESQINRYTKLLISPRFLYLTSHIDNSSNNVSVESMLRASFSSDCIDCLHSRIRANLLPFTRNRAPQSFNKNGLFTFSQMFREIQIYLGIPRLDMLLCKKENRTLQKKLSSFSFRNSIPIK